MRSLHHVPTKCLLAAFALAAVAPSAHAVTLWDWSFQTDITDQYGSGTFTTADVEPTAGAVYTIAGVSGTYYRGGTAYAITGLDSNVDNTFQWAGNPSSINVGYYGYGFGISFLFEEGDFLDLQQFTSTEGYSQIADTISNFSGADGKPTISNIAPRSAAPVPAPLPLFGAAAAFSAVRRLRGLSGRLHRSEG